jgi:hypothetical protein
MIAEKHRTFIGDAVSRLSRRYALQLMPLNGGTRIYCGGTEPPLTRERILPRAPAGCLLVKIKTGSEKPWEEQPSSSSCYVCTRP